MINLIKNNKVLSFIIVVLVFGILFLLIPIAINKMYINNEGYITVWGGEDVLLFYGTVLSFLGTIFLGGLALWQNERLNNINKNLTEHQYKPILSNTIIDLNDPKEKECTWFRTIEQTQDGVMINNGYSSKQTYYPYAILGIRNIGLGPGINIATYLWKLTSVDGIESLDKIIDTNIDNFYDKIHLDNYDYYEDDKLLNGNWQIYTDFNLGVSEMNNSLNLVFSFENISEPLHSIIEFQYENILGKRFKQYIYLNFDNSPSILPISKVY